MGTLAAKGVTIAALNPLLLASVGFIIASKNQIFSLNIEIIVLNGLIKMHKALIFGAVIQCGDLS